MLFALFCSVLFPLKKFMQYILNMFCLQNLKWTIHFLLPRQDNAIFSNTQKSTDNSKPTFMICYGQMITHRLQSYWSIWNLSVFSLASDFPYHLYPHVDRACLGKLNKASSHDRTSQIQILGKMLDAVNLILLSWCLCFTFLN